MKLILVSAASLALASRLDVEPQSPPTRIGERIGTVSHGFTAIAGARELADGRLLILDRRERELRLADLVANTTTPVGRTGSGPLEYRTPTGLIALPDGRTLLSDPGNARMLEISAQGAIRGIWAPSQNRNRLISLVVAWDSRGADAQGRIYFDQTPPPLKAGESRQAPIVRLDPARGRFDTVGTYLVTSEMQTVVQPGSRSGEVIIRPRAYSTVPHWRATLDGSVAIVTPQPYQVRWQRASGNVDGPVIAFSPVPVTAADREAITNEVRRTPRGGSSPSEPPSPGSVLKRGGGPLFPDFMPAFAGRESVVADPDGRIWVARAGHVADSVIVYDVFDGAGRLTRRVQMPPNRRIIAFGAVNTLVIRTDENDLEYLEVYKR